MSDSMDEGLPNLEVKLGKMIDKLIETDEDLEKNGLNSFYFSDERCESKYKKLFEKELPNNSNMNNSQIINSSQIMSNAQLNKTINIPQNVLYNNYNYYPNNCGNISTIIYNNNNNYPNNFYNPMFPQQMNNLSNHSLFSLNNSYINTTNTTNTTNMNTANTTSSFSFNRQKSLELNNYNNNANKNFNKSNININNNNNIYPNKVSNSFCDTNENNYIFKKNTNSSFLDLNNSPFLNNNNKINNIFNTNVELEILLIQVKKILNKIQKIDISVYTKCKDKFEQIIRTHKGSRIFQNYLKKTHYDILHLIFSELKNKLPELLKDSYSNYFCKKLFKNLSQKDRIEYLTLIQNDLSILSTDPIATYPIQSIIEELGSKAEKNIFFFGIKNSIDNFGYHIYGARILEKILSYLEDDFHKDIIDYICNNFIELAYNANGICLVKKILLMTNKIELHKILKKLIKENALNLIVHQYGNYAVQTIVENWDESDLEEIIEIYKDKYVFLSNKKFASNVIERIIEKNGKNLENYLNEIYKGYNLVEILKNKYGNFVLKKAVDLANGKIKEKLVEEINDNLKFLENPKIINRWKNNLVLDNNSSSI